MEERIKIIPISQPFLKVLAGYYFDKFKESRPDFSKRLVVFPSERNKFYFRRFLLEAVGIKGIIPPTMFTIDELINYIYEQLGGEQARILHSIERNFILKKTIDDLKIELWQNLPFLRFISIGNRLLNFFDELSQEKIGIRDIEKKSKEFHYPERYIKDELPILIKVYEQYRKNLNKAGYIDEIDKIEKVYKDYDSKIFADFESITIAGIVAPTSFERFIIQRMLRELPTELILHSGTIEELSCSNDGHKRFFLHYKLLKSLNVDIPKVYTIDYGSVPPAVIHIKPLETPTKQAFYLSEIVPEAIKKYKEPHRIGIVLTDQSLLFPITETLRSLGIEYNLSAGIPLSNQIFYSFLNYLYRTVKSAFHYSEFFVFLQHPLIKNAIIGDIHLRALVYRLRKEMLNKKQSHFNRALYNGEPELIPLLDFLERCFTTAQQNLPFNEYIESLHQLLNEVLLFNREIITKNLPGIKEFFEELDYLAQLRIEYNTINSGIDIVEFILKVLEDGRYHIEGEPLKGVQIIGILEARNLDFDCIIIPSMNEGIFPKRSEKDMFINPSLRKEMGLVTRQERENLYYYYFTQLMSGKKEVFLSYITEEKRDIPSRFIMMLESAGYKEDKEPIIFSQSAINIPGHSVKKDGRLVRTLLKICNSGLSHTLLRTYKRCPYKFYLKHLLLIKEPETISDEFDPLTWGSMFHEIVKEFYKRHYPKGFDRSQRDKVLEKFEELLEHYMNSGKYIAVPPKPAIYFNIALYKIYIEKFIKNELIRFEQGYKVVPEYAEKEITHSIEIGNRTILLKGYVDRVDINNGEYYIIDYKTGQLPARRTYEIGDEFVEFQLPLYALMFLKEGDKKIGGLIYYKIGRETQTHLIYGREGVIDYLDRFREKILIHTIDEMLNTDIPFYQTTNMEDCKDCSYNTICGRRRHEGD